MILTSLKIHFLAFIILGLVYPYSLVCFGNFFFPFSSQGSLIQEKGRLIGSELIAQKFEKEAYFWPRPSASDYSALPSMGSQFSPTSLKGKKIRAERIEKWKKKHPHSLGNPPEDLLSASGSGLDPEVSWEAVRFQIPRIAQARGISEAILQQRITTWIQKRKATHINVLLLNQELDRLP